jgi:hypothetical protein
MINRALSQGVALGWNLQTPSALVINYILAFASLRENPMLLN